MKDNNWEIVSHDREMKCDECKHTAKEWAENEKFTEVNIDGETCNEVRCPNCHSYFYFETEKNEESDE